MTTVTDLKDQGLACFKHVSTGKKLTQSGHYAVFADIADRLGDENFLADGLRRLEDAMWQELSRRCPTPSGFFAKRRHDPKKAFKRYFKVDENLERDPSRAKPEYKPYKGLLSTVLKDTEAQNGFGDVSYAWGVSAEAFLTNLLARRPFKDYSASSNYHGEYTHRIQWWIVCNTILPPSGNNARYYEECAYWTCLLTDVKRTVYLWDYLFDSAYNTTGLSGSVVKGRNPNTVLTACKNAEQYPLLAAFIRYRSRKASKLQVKMMQSEDADTKQIMQSDIFRDVSEGVLERAAQRFLNTSFDALSRENKLALLKVITDLGFTDHGLQ